MDSFISFFGFFVLNLGIFAVALPLPVGFSSPRSRGPQRPLPNIGAGAG